MRVSPSRSVQMKLVFLFFVLLHHVHIVTVSVWRRSDEEIDTLEHRSIRSHRSIELRSMIFELLVDTKLVESTAVPLIILRAVALNE
jgi:hypothetical protein